ncbi:MAG: hypothetical protein HYT76_03655 [Deltaproteobacteria bacterium]|nr:hypothetical protein [Deltaproteobacteria bacterium]
MGIICQLPDFIDPTLDLFEIDDKRRQDPRYNLRIATEIPDSDDPITYAPSETSIDQHPLEQFLSGSTLTKYYGLLVAIDKRDGSLDGRFSGHKFRRFIKEKEGYVDGIPWDGRWASGDSRNLRRFALTLSGLYQKCHLVEEGSSVPDGGVNAPDGGIGNDGGSITEVDASRAAGAVSAEATPVYSEPPSWSQLVGNFFVDNHAIVVGALLLVTLGLLRWSRIRGLRPAVEEIVDHGTAVGAREPPWVSDGALLRSRGPARASVPDEATVRLARTAAAQEPSVTVHVDSTDGRLIIGRAPTVRAAPGGAARVVVPDVGADGGTFAGALGPRPEGRIVVGVGERAPDRLLQDATALRSLDEVDWSGDLLLRRVTVSFEGWTIELDAGRFEHFLTFSKGAITGMVEQGTYRINNPRALEEYRKLVVITKAWHSGPGGYHHVPILPGGRFTLSEEARRLLSIQGGLDLPTETEILVSETQLLARKGISIVTVEAMSKASHKLIDAAEEHPDLRDRIFALLEEIFETPYFRTSF